MTAGGVSCIYKVASTAGQAAAHLSAGAMQGSALAGTAEVLVPLAPSHPCSGTSVDVPFEPGPRAVTSGAPGRFLALPASGNHGLLCLFFYLPLFQPRPLPTPYLTLARRVRRRNLFIVYPREVSVASTLTFSPFTLIHPFALGAAALSLTRSSHTRSRMTAWACLRSLSASNPRSRSERLVPWHSKMSVVPLCAIAHSASCFTFFFFLHLCTLAHLPQSGHLIHTRLRSTPANAPDRNPKPQTRTRNNQERPSR